MASTLKKVVIALGVLALIGFLMFGTLIAVVVIGDNEAKEKANALCAPGLVGVPAGTALERARKSGASTVDPKWSPKGNGSDQMMVAFPAWLPLTGYMCWIEAKDGVVTRNYITTVD
jgi:hypothetical protein